MMKAMIKINTAFMQLCCIYMLFSAMILNTDAVFSFYRLIPGYVAGALLYMALTKQWGSNPKTLYLIHIAIGILYGAAIFLLLTKELPWVWVWPYVKQFLKEPFEVVKSIFDEFTITTIGTLLWFLGWRLGKMQVRFLTMFTEFQMGFGMLFILLILIQGFKLSVPYFFFVIIAFFILGLTVLALSKEAEKPPSANKGDMARSKMLYAFTGMVLIFIIAALLVFFISPEIMGQIIQFFKSITTWCWHQVLKVVDFFMSLLPDWASERLSRIPEETDSSSGEGSISPIRWLVYAIGNIANGLFWAGFVLFCLWQMALRLIKSMKKWQVPSQQISYDTISGGLRSDLRLWTKQVGQKLRGFFAWTILQLSRILPLYLIFPNTFSKTPEIERIYTKMLKWSVKNKAPRSSSQTPAEHEQTLSERWPGTQHPMDVITRLYETYIYGGNVLLNTEEEQLILAWKQLNQIDTNPKRRKKPDGRRGFRFKNYW